MGMRSTPIDIQVEMDQPSSSKSKKDTRIKKLKQNLRDYKVLERHLKQENIQLKERFH